MMERMIPDPMSFAVRSLGTSATFAILQLVTEDEKRSAQSKLLKHIEDQRRNVGVRTVIEGQRDATHVLVLFPQYVTAAESACVCHPIFVVSVLVK